jgi:hypothetical protein
VRQRAERRRASNFLSRSKKLGYALILGSPCTGPWISGTNKRKNILETFKKYINRDKIGWKIRFLVRKTRNAGDKSICLIVCCLQQQQDKNREKGKEKKKTNKKGWKKILLGKSNI